MYRPNKALPPHSRYLSLYARLGVSPNASTDAIRLAYQVLEEAYCPGGAYTDDAMQLSFSEIRNAAKLLSNPKTRKLYDLGYIEEAGRRTDAGFAHAARFRKSAMACALLTFAGAAVLFFGFWSDPKDAPARSTASGLQSHRDATPAKVAAALPQAAANPSLVTPLKPVTAPPPAVSPKPAADKTIRHPEHASAPVQLETASPLKNTPRIARPKALRSRPPALARDSNPPVTRRRYAQRLERRRHPEYYGQEPSSPWETDTWFPNRPAPYPYDAETAWPRPTLRSAQCLACLADGADCSGICP